MTASLIFLVAGCGSTNSNSGGDLSPTVTIAASPATIAAGKASTLTVVAANASTVTVAGSDGSSYKMTPTGGTQSVTPAATTTYTATASDAKGSATAKVVVTVTPAAAAPTVKITASPASIAPGASSTLTVTAANAQTVTISGDDGSSYTLQSSGGTQVVSPAKTTIYTATASGAGGKATANATVTVSAGPPPTVTITASPSSISAGGSSTLTVAATNATTVAITGSDGSSYHLAASGGTQTVKPTTTTTYTATATGPGGKTTATAAVTVVTPPTVKIAANPTTINAGSSSTLTVVATNATAVTITGSDGSNYPLGQTGGTQVVAPAATTTYTVTAAAGQGTTPVTAQVTVTVVPAPPPPVPTVTLAANPTTITVGGSSTLSVTAANATTVVLQGTDGSAYTLSPTGGTKVVTPKVTTTYTATANGPGGASVPATVIVTVNQPPTPTVTLSANPTSIASGSSSVLTVSATNTTSVTITGTDGSSYPITVVNGSVTNATQTVKPTSTTTYTATADGGPGVNPVTATATVTIVPPGSVKSISHVIFMLQENHSFDDYFGMLNTYRLNNGFSTTDDVDGIDDKVNGESYTADGGVTRSIVNNDQSGNPHTLFPFKSTCVDDMSSAWAESFGDVSLGNKSTGRTIKMNGYASNADGFAAYQSSLGHPGFTDTTGDRSMGYYDQNFLNYYYFMASSFAISDRWFSPIESKSIPNRIATFTGGTTQGLTRDPSQDDKIGSQLVIDNIFQKLDTANVSWKVYYTVNNGECDPEDCKKQISGSALYPATAFSYLSYSYKYLYGNKKAPDPSGCVAPASPSSMVGDSSNTFCIDLNKIAPINDPTYGYFADLKNGTLPSFSFIESGSGLNDEHPGYQQSILVGQAQVAKIINALMGSTSWKDSVFFLAYDEGGGPYDHVPPVPGHTNDFTDDSQVANYPTDVTNISVSADSWNPCVPSAQGSLHCDLQSGQPGSSSTDAAFCPLSSTPDTTPGTYCAHAGFGAQLGFRVPNLVISPFVKKSYVSHIPMDHTAIIKFVEDRFIGNGQYLTKRDAAQPNLLDFFDFTDVPWATPPSPPTPMSVGSSCQPSNFH